MMAASETNLDFLYSEVFTPEQKYEWCMKAIDFVLGIGIPVKVSDRTNALDTFLPHIRIEYGELVVSPRRAFPGDILHEAGHIALLPRRLRIYALDDLQQALQMGSEILRQPDCSAYTQAAIRLSASDAAVTAWQFAAHKKIGLPKALLFPLQSYGGQENLIYVSLDHNNYVGINELTKAGLTMHSEQMNLGAPVFPQLKSWLFPDEFEIKPEIFTMYPYTSKLSMLKGLSHD